MRTSTTTLLVLAITAVAGTLYTFKGRLDRKDPLPPTEQAVRMDILDQVIATGSIVPRHEVALKPRVAGIVAQVFVEPGDRVTKGQKVARIEVIAQESSLAEYESRVRAAQIVLTHAEQELEEAESLSKVGIASNDELRAARFNVAQAEENLRASKDGLNAVRTGAVRKTENAANMVLATIDGKILAVPSRAGTSVVDNNSFNEGTTIATLANMDDLIFIGWADESDVGRLREGMPLSLTIGALRDHVVEGKVERIAPKGEDRKGVTQFEVRAAVNATQGPTLRAGFSANARIIIERRDDVLAIPEKLLKFDEDQPFVEVLVNEEPVKFERRDVELGLSDGIHAEVLGGLTGEERIRLPEADH